PARRDDHVRVALVLVDELDLHPPRGPRADGVLDDRLDAPRLLVRHEPAAYLGERLARDDGLRPLALVAAAYPVELQGRLEPHGLERAEPRRRVEGVDAQE